MYATFQGDDSSSDEIVSTSERVARLLQSCFDCKEEDIGLAGNISIKTGSKKRRLVETASVSSEFYTISSGATSRCKPIRKKGPPKERCEPRISS